MYYSKKNAEPVEERETVIWSCSDENCECWMRENFSFAKEPVCPICNSTMEQSTKILPVLNNSFQY